MEVVTIAPSVLDRSGGKGKGHPGEEGNDIRCGKGHREQCHSLSIAPSGNIPNQRAYRPHRQVPCSPFPPIQPLLRQGLPSSCYGHTCHKAIPHERLSQRSLQRETQDENDCKGPVF